MADAPGGGDDPALRELFRHEAEGIVDRLEVVVQAATAEGLAEARRLAHTLKGLAVALGAHPLRDLARSLEEGLGAGADGARLLPAVDAARALVGGATGAATAARAAAAALQAGPVAATAAPGVPWARRALARRLTLALAPALVAVDEALAAAARGRDDRRARAGLAREVETLAAALGLVGRADVASPGLALAGLLHERAPAPAELRAARTALEATRGAAEAVDAPVDAPLPPAALALVEPLHRAAQDEERVERAVELPWPDADRPVDLLAALERLTDGAAVLDARPTEPDGRALRGALGLGPPRAARREDDGFVRVPRRRLDRLLRLSEELVAVKAQTRAMARRAATLAGEVSGAAGLGSARLARDAAELDRSLDDLARRAQEAVLRARLVPVRGLWALARVTVREHLARHPDKDVALEVEGAATEVDKGVVDQLVDPLLHLVRNALVHGVAPRAARAERGKPERARVRLAARATPAGVVLEVEDDGEGLDPARGAGRRALLVRDEAGGVTALGAPDAGAGPRPPVTDDAGRGLGLAAVVERVRSLRGRFELQGAPGRGTLARIVLPPAAATARVLLVRVGPERFALPLSSVVAVREAPAGGADGRAAVRLADLVGPAEGEGEAGDRRRSRRASARERRGRDRFAVVVAPPGAAQAPDAPGGLAVLVDDVLRRDLVVVRPLGRRFAPPGVDGAALLGDGRLVLVVDPWALDAARSGPGPAGP